MKPVLTDSQNVFLSSLSDMDSVVVELVAAAMLLRNAAANGIVEPTTGLHSNAGVEALQMLARVVDDVC